MLVIRLTLIGALCLGGCGGSAQPEITLPADLTLKAGEQRAINGLNVTFLGVKEDSRCPEGVQCVWAGNAAVELRIEGGADTAAVTLNSGTEPTAIGVQGLLFTFKSLAPAPKAGAGAPASSELTLRIESTR